MTTDKKRECEQQDDCRLQQKDSEEGGKQIESKKPRREQQLQQRDTHGFLLFSGHRRPRVGADYQVTALPEVTKEGNEENDENDENDNKLS